MRYGSGLKFLAAYFLGKVPGSWYFAKGGPQIHWCVLLTVLWTMEKFKCAWDIVVSH